MANNITEIGFEKQIWDAADELRGSMDAAEYKHVVLGLIFLKYLSDKFEERYQELVVKEKDLKKILMNTLIKMYFLFLQKPVGQKLLKKLILQKMV